MIEDSKEEDDVKQIVSLYENDRYNLIPILQQIQENLGYIPSFAMYTIADHLDISYGEVYGVTTFYNQFRLNPPGKHPIKVCIGTACHIKGAGIILESWERRLKIKEGETTEDREFSLDSVACVGCCCMAPVAVIGSEFHGDMMTTKVDGLLLNMGVDLEKKDG
ncbi:MAG: NADH-quinone oxidoreductase subunit NuoE [Thermodesulfobacteriota bacterium]|nr:NADH-quinone oxidoreductase subunit NuoE [Thermodesulfobacteriota bacterium]